MRRILLLTITLMMSACQTSSKPTEGSVNNTRTDTSVVDTPVSTPFIVPTPDSDNGVVVGMIYSLSAQSPLAGFAIYLGERVPLTPGPGYLVTIKQQGSPNTIADTQGRFVLAGIPPGDYPLLVWTPFNSYVVPDANGEREMSVIIRAGEVTDLGKIEVDWP